MKANIEVICYKYKPLKDGTLPLMLRVTKDRKRKYVSLGSFRKNLICVPRCRSDNIRHLIYKLKREGFTAVSDNLTELAEVNFFTSRFYSAVDIKLDYQPNVIVLTDVFHAPYSMIDPQTEVVQAIGRFRNGVA